MKKITLIVAAVIFAVSCNTADKIKEAENQRDSLQALVNQRDASLNDYLASFNTIELTLDSINSRQKNIFLRTDNATDLKTPTIASEINFEIAAINNLLEKNQQEIENLNNALKKSGNKSVELEKAITKLNSQLTQKQEELSSLNSKLMGLNIEVLQLQATISMLNANNALKDEFIAKETKALHTAYYIIGTAKELEKEKIIDKTGGLLGIGKTTELNSEFNSEKFTKIDDRETLTIPLNSKKAKVITNHSADSYKLEKDKNIFTALSITNSEAFWKTSKYLVIVTGS